MKRLTLKTPGAGFTLIEMMITVAIIAILAAVALPAYTNNVLRTQRATAKAVLVENAQLLERFYTTTPTGTYKDGPLGSNVSPKGAIGNAIRYNIALTGADANGFTLTATPTTAQSKDDCGELSLKNTGAQGAVKGGVAVAGCW